MKKFLSILLVLTMLFSLCGSLSVFAADEEPTEEVLVDAEEIDEALPEAAEDPAEESEPVEVSDSEEISAPVEEEPALTLEEEVEAPAVDGGDVPNPYVAEVGGVQYEYYWGVVTVGGQRPSDLFSGFTGDLNTASFMYDGVNHKENLQGLGNALNNYLHITAKGDNYVYFRSKSTGYISYCTNTDIGVGEYYLKDIKKVQPGSFSDLQGLIAAAADGGTVTLSKDYTYDSSKDNSNKTITINKTITLNLNGHIISGNSENGNSVITIQEGRTLTLTDSSETKTGKITGGQGTTGNYGKTYGGGVYNKGTFVMQGGTISGNTANNGGAVYNTGSFEMSGGEISNNSSNSNTCGGVFNAGTFNMTGGKISNNTGDQGGGVRNAGTFTMTGGEITGNTSDSGGGGVYVDTGTFTMTGGEIKNNTASSYGGVLYVDGTFTVGGTANITGNKKGEDANNVFLPNNKTITISTETPLTTGASIGVNTYTTPTQDSPVTISGTNSTDYSSYFSSDNSDYRVEFNTDHLELVVAKTAINPSVSLEGWTYGESAKTPSVTGNTGNGTITYSYKEKNAEDSTYSTTVPTKAGTYTVKATIAETNDYFSGSCTADFTIAKAKVAVPSAESDLTYNGSEQTGVVLPDGAPYTLEDNAKTNAGEYTATATLTDKDNYEWKDENTSEDQSIEWVIARKALTIPAKHTTLFSGEEIPADAIAFDGLVEDEKLTTGFDTEYKSEDAYDASKTVFTMKPVVTADEVSTNYDITYVSGTLTVEPVVYKYKDGSKETTTVSLTYTLESDEGVTFTSVGEYEDFVAFYLDGNKVDPANYTVKESSPTVLTLKSSYLDTLSTGKHTVKFEFKHGATEGGTLTIKEQTKAADNNKAAKTGDSATPALWALLCVLSVTGLGYTATRRKHN